MNARTCAAIAAGISLLPTAQPRRESVLLLGASHTVAYSKHLTCTTLARSGEQTLWMRERLPHLLVRGDYRDVIMLAGVNDVLSDVPGEEIIRRLESLERIARSGGANPVFVTLPAFAGYEPESWERRAASLALVNRWIRGRPGHIDAARLLCEGGALKPEYRRPALPDGYLHANERGYRRLAELVHAHAYGRRRR